MNIICMASSPQKIRDMNSLTYHPSDRKKNELSWKSFKICLAVFLSVFAGFFVLLFFVLFWPGRKKIKIDICNFSYLFLSKLAPTFLTPKNNKNILHPTSPRPTRLDPDPSTDSGLHASHFV